MGVSPGIQVRSDTPLSLLLIAGNPLDKLQASSKDTERVIAHVAQDYQVRRLGYHGVVENDMQFHIELDFSNDDGVSFASPMFEMEGNRIFQWRCKIAQLQAQPLLRGFATAWYLPNGWTFTDTLGTTLYDESVSNPLIVTRTIRSPVDPQPAAFEVEVTEVFR